MMDQVHDNAEKIEKWFWFNEIEDEWNSIEDYIPKSWSQDPTYLGW
jgi:hypothetical protein